MGWIVLGSLVLLIILLIGMYNNLVRLAAQCDNSWADIDVQLKRRYDLIPNLVETVKGYAAHEQGTLDAVIMPAVAPCLRPAPPTKAKPKRSSRAR